MALIAIVAAMMAVVVMTVKAGGRREKTERNG